MVRLITSELNGKLVAYCSETVFSVQVGKGKKGSYKTRYAFKGNLGQAVIHYNGVNVGNGYKKRLMMSSKVLHRILPRGDLF